MGMTLILVMWLGPFEQTSESDGRWRTTEAYYKLTNESLAEVS